MRSFAWESRGHRLAPKRVLIVDDDPLTRGLVRDFLDRAQYEVGEAVGTTEGLLQAKMHHPHVILLDLMMPGIDGFEVRRSLKLESETRDIRSPDQNFPRRSGNLSNVRLAELLFRIPTTCAREYFSGNLKR